VLLTMWLPFKAQTTELPSP